MYILGILGDLHCTSLGTEIANPVVHFVVDTCLRSGVDPHTNQFKSDVFPLMDYRNYDRVGVGLVKFRLIN